MAYGDNGKNKKFNRIGEIVFNPQSTMIIGSFLSELGISEKSIRLWSVKNGALMDVIPLETIRGYKYPIAVSYDGNFIAISLYSKEVWCYSLKDKKWLWKANWLEKERKNPQEIKFTPDDRNIIAVGEKHIVIYDAATGHIQEVQKKPLSDYTLFRSSITGAVLSPSGSYLAAWQRLPTPGYEQFPKLFMNRKVTVWDIGENKSIAQWKKPKKDICSVAFTPDEKYILMAVKDYITEWSITEQKMIRQWKVHKYYIDYLTISPNGKFIASFGYYANVKIWDYMNKKVLYEFENIGTRIGGYKVCDSNAMAFSPDSKYFALEKNGYLCLYETSTWKEKWCVPSYSEE